MSPLTRIQVVGFKRFEAAAIELSDAVVLVGPNDSGKTSALQSLALWQTGVRKLVDRHGSRKFPASRAGVTVNRLELSSVPVPHSAMLWRDTRTREPENVLFGIEVTGEVQGAEWKFAVQYDYVNSESVRVQPRRDPADPDAIPVAAASISVAYLPPMSGLSSDEPLWTPARTRALIGQGQTAQVLRNVCLELAKDADAWDSVKSRIFEMFGAEIDRPVEIEGKLTMGYVPRGGRRLDLSSAGRGMQQTLLLLAFLRTNPGAVILLDEPDSHLEVLRQREVYNAVVDAARETGGQVVAATHSEVVLQEALLRHRVFAFVGDTPRELARDDLDQVRKALEEIPAEDYYLAKTVGWVLYLEGETDLAILSSLARRLEHPAELALRSPFVIYVGNQPSRARSHFFGVRYSNPELRGYALFDRLELLDQPKSPLVSRTWSRREIENYLVVPDALRAWAGDQDGGGLGGIPWVDAMDRALVRIDEALQAVEGRGIESPDLNASSRVLEPIFRAVFEDLGRRNFMSKGVFSAVADYLAPDQIDPEVVDVLDQISRLAEGSR